MVGSWSHSGAVKVHSSRNKKRRSFGLYGMLSAVLFPRLRLPHRDGLEVEKLANADMTALCIPGRGAQVAKLGHRGPREHRNRHNTNGDKTTTARFQPLYHPNHQYTTRNTQHQASTGHSPYAKRPKKAKKKSKAEGKQKRKSKQHSKPDRLADLNVQKLTLPDNPNRRRRRRRRRHEVIQRPHRPALTAFVKAITAPRRAPGEKESRRRRR